MKLSAALEAISKCLRSTLLAGKDIDVTCTSGSVNFTAGEAVIDAMKFTTSAVTIDLFGWKDIDVTCTSGSVNFTAGEAVIDAMKFTTTSAAEKAKPYKHLK